MNISHYRLLKKLGEGAMGEVYLAQDTSLNRYVALKLLPSHFTRDADRLARFHREAEVASLLNHPNVLTIHEVGVDRETHFIVTEYVEGENLRQRLDAGPLRVGEAIRIAIEIAEALNAAHEYWVVHRDVKPENVMVRRDGYVKVLDFGLAKLTEPALLSGKARFDTLPGVVPGTVLYVAPERINGDAADPRSDLFSLGVVLYEMVAGKRPFDGTSLVGIMDAILHSAPPPLVAATGEPVPDDLQRIVDLLLQKDADERYQSTREVIAELKEVKAILDYDETQRRRRQRGTDSATER